MGLNKEKHNKKTPHSCADHSSSKADIEVWVQRLKDNGLRLTRPRQSLIEAITAQSGPFSADELYKSGQRFWEDGNCDLVTVYRSLSTFADIGVLSRVDLGDAVVRYELNSRDGHHHHHVICTNCKNVLALSTEINSELEKQFERQEARMRKLGYTQLTHRFEFFALCPACSAAN